MSAPDSRFQAQNKTTQQRVSDQTVGLVKLSDFRKRRAEVLEQQEREVREAAVAASSNNSNNGGTDRSQTGTPDPNATNSDASNNNADGTEKGGKEQQRQKKLLGNKKRKIAAKSKLSFGDDDEEEQAEGEGGASESAAGDKNDKAATAAAPKKAKFKANANVSIVPRAVTKSALQREAAERDALRREFLLKQEAVKATEIAIPFVFYDGTNLPGGVARVKKGDFTWIFLDKSRKVGAELGVGEKTNARREWARIGVDDLMLVRGGLIIPHHYEFLYFIMNKTLGPNNQILFDYSAEPPAVLSSAPAPSEDTPAEPMSAADRRAAAAKIIQPDIDTLEGASDDPTFTKVVDRRWYERNKHIYPASTWQDFDPEHDYQSQIRKDPRSGNTFFY